MILKCDDAILSFYIICLALCYRKSQLIKLQNGEYISLGRIETALQGSPFVEQACVFARPQKRGSVALIVPDRAVCRKMTNWKSDSTPAILQVKEGGTKGESTQEREGRDFKPRFLTQSDANV